LELLLFISLAETEKVIKKRQNETVVAFCLFFYTLLFIQALRIWILFLGTVLALIKLK
jgi:hypothetical protein